MDIATRVLGANKVAHYMRDYEMPTLMLQLAHWSNFYAGDPYTGDREAEIKEKNRKINELEEEVSRLRKQLDQRYIFNEPVMILDSKYRTN